MNIFELLPWGPGKVVQTSRGQRLLRTAAPTPGFWGLWKTDQQTLRDAGVSPSKQSGAWEVCWWQSAPAQAPEADEPAPAPRVPSRTPAARAAGQDDQAPVQPIFGRRQAPSSEPRAKVPAGKSWSQEQLAIFDWFSGGAGNLVVVARAGTGKTTTIKAAFEVAPEEAMLYAVFNKKNQREAMEKITDGRVDVRTLHSLGFRYIKEVWPDAAPSDEVERARLDSVVQDCPDEVATAVLKLVSLAKNTLLAPTAQEVEALALEWDVYAGAYEDSESGGWTVSKLAATAVRVIEAARTRDAQGRVSFDDMVWLPAAACWVRPWFDLVVVDEAQDMNLPQLVMARKACKPAGRVCVVGDDRQAIYGFRGAVQDAMEWMRTQLNAKRLGLTTTYRCPKAVVELARVTVPDYQAAPSAPEGSIESLTYDAALASLKVGDAVLSRANAPLVSACLQLLRKGVPARIEGRDIGRTLVAFVRKTKSRSVPDFLRKVETWAAKMVKRHLAGTSRPNDAKAQAKVAAVRDQAQTLTAIAEGAASVAEVEARVLALFQDTDSKGPQKPAVVLSSVHKAKGLEWDRVALLCETFRAGKGVLEEDNIWYVAVTRAKAELVLVDNGQAAVRGGRVLEALGLDAAQPADN